MALMTGTRYRRRDALGAARGRLLAALVTVALLLCHGVFGGLHLAQPSGPSAEASGMHHPTAQQESSGDSGRGAAGGSAHEPGASSYFAVLLVLFGAAALKLLAGLRTLPITVAALRSSRPRHPPVADALPRGPTLP